MGFGQPFACDRPFPCRICKKDVPEGSMIRWEFDRKFRACQACADAAESQPAAGDNSAVIHELQAIKEQLDRIEALLNPFGAQ